MGPTQPVLSSEQAIALDPHLALAHNVLGFCYFRAGDYPRAYNAYAEALRLQPANALFAYDVALALEKQNKIAEAIPFAEKAAAATPPPPSAHYLCGKLYAKGGKLPDAIHELETAIELNPSMRHIPTICWPVTSTCRVGDTQKSAGMEYQVPGPEAGPGQTDWARTAIL